nr:immunoglobulin heavy chain junction region [Macaca mulatta]MOW98078.1 immunoglobulin heavy chain junction region [Macaca mulatta]MOW98109.1 immunoglobulin heavy chain junction region [Macaca mulatta]MOW98213.1 immunoglobulin heavy chain junction region [Macaca mulatta]MOW98265.1 immunoglobulin heavy chain junction region [Macaca mulatta]
CTSALSVYRPLVFW